MSASTPNDATDDYFTMHGNNSTSSQAQIEIRTTPIGLGHRHSYLIFRSAEGGEFVLRGSPSGNAETFGTLDNTLLGKKSFGKIRVDMQDYKPTVDPSTGKVTFPVNWDINGTDEKRILWTGTNEELHTKLDQAIITAIQINTAQFEYSPLHNNCNNFTNTILNSINITPRLPFQHGNRTVSAPGFNEPLYQNIGIACQRSGYSFDGNTWIDKDGHTPVYPPEYGKPYKPRPFSEPYSRPQKNTNDVKPASQEKSDRNHSSIHQQSIVKVNTLHQVLHDNVGKQIQQAGAGRFADNMVADCTYHCIKNGITAENINNMHVDTTQNKIFIHAKHSGKFAVIDAINAAKVDPVQRLQEAIQLQEDKDQQPPQEQNLESAQRQGKNGPKLA